MTDDTYQATLLCDRIIDFEGEQLRRVRYMDMTVDGVTTDRQLFAGAMFIIKDDDESDSDAWEGVKSWRCDFSVEIDLDEYVASGWIQAKQ